MLNDDELVEQIRLGDEEAADLTQETFYQQSREKQLFYALGSNLVLMR